MQKTARQLLAGGLLGATAAAAAAFAAPAADAAVVSRFVMRINDEVATLRDYELRKAEMEEALLSRPDLTLQQRRDALSRLGERVFRQMYEDLLLVSRANQLGISITDQQVDEQLLRIRERMGLTSDEDFRAALDSSGMTLAQLREQTRKNLLSQTVLSREVYSLIEVDEEILRRYYRDHPEEFQVPERLRLRELVVLDEPTADPAERRRLATEIREQALEGRLLEEIAAERSAEGLTSGLIDLGWVSAGDLDPELERAVWGLDLNALSEPIEARGGAHLVEVVGREPATLRPFTEVIEEIRGRERERRAVREIEEYMTRLEDDAFIVLDPPPEAEGFRRLAAEPDQGPDLLAPGPLGDGGPPIAAGDEPASALGELGTGDDEDEPAEPVPPSSPEPPPPEP